MKMIFASVVLVVLVQCSLGQNTNIVDTLTNLGLNTLKDSLDTAGLSDALRSGCKYPSAF